jgi:uncharacterized protein (DUF1499 family)
MLWFALLAPPLLAAAALYAAAVTSRGAQPPTDLVDGRLRSCPATPNCVCSEPGGGSDAQRIDPLPVGDDAAAAWAALQRAITDAGGRPHVTGRRHLAATFRTPLFGFVDDLEARLDPEAGVIHLRSASRVGRSDLGANRARVVRIAAAYVAQLEAGETR